jgi:hypothetical protein
MSSPMEPDVADLLVELVEKMGLLRTDMRKRNELDKWAARITRVDSKLSSLAERISRTDPDLAKRIRTAWQLPGRSLAFRNADHQKELKRTPSDEEGEPES